MATIDEKQKELIEEFSWFDDWRDKYQYLIDLGKEPLDYPEEFMNEEYRVKGCVAQVWLRPLMEGNQLSFQAGSDPKAFISKGLIILITKLLSGHTPQEILDADLFFINEVGLGTHLSPTRSNGLDSMIKQIKMYALAYSQQA